VRSQVLNYHAMSAMLSHHWLCDIFLDVDVVDEDDAPVVCCQTTAPLFLLSLCFTGPLYLTPFLFSANSLGRGPRQFVLKKMKRKGKIKKGGRSRKRPE